MAAPSFALFALAYYVLAGLGVNLAYHRVLSHRSLHLPKWLERALVTIGLPAGTPVQWAGTHRYHHATADTALDPHSPVQRGFLYAHVGLVPPLGESSAVPCLRRWRTGADAGRRVDASPHQSRAQCARGGCVCGPLVSLHQPTVALCGRHASARWDFALAGSSMVGAAGVLGIWLTLVALYNAGDAIDSVAHVFGPKLEKQQDESRNSAWMGILVAPGSLRRKTKTPTTALVLLGASGARGRAQLVTRKEAQRLWRA